MSTDLGGFNTTRINLAGKVIGWLKNHSSQQEAASKAQQKTNGKKVGAIDSPTVQSPNVKPLRSRQFNDSYTRTAGLNNAKPGTNPASQGPKHAGQPAQEGRREQPSFGKHARGRHQGGPAQEGMHEPPAFGRHMKP